ncbi:glycosyltransferase family 2 protein [Vallitalea sediminicola]
MITISLCMIVRDESLVLDRCLESIYKIVDEIIIVDTGSKDNTKEIALKYTDKIYDFQWVDDFSKARNYSFSLATKEYILWLDADDIILKEDMARLKEIKKMLSPTIDVVMMKYNLMVQNGEPTISFYRERLLKRTRNYKWYSPVHEYIDFRGAKTYTSEVCITHKKEHAKSDRNLKILEKQFDNGKELSPRNWFYYARELYFHGKYDKAIIYYEKFLDTEGEYLSNYIDSCIDLSKIYTAKNKPKKCLKTLIRSLEYDLPRAEICCYIGYYYKKYNQYNKAIFYFDLATRLVKPEKRWGFILHDFWDFIPYTELSICNYKLGNLKQAILNNDMALKYKPKNKILLNNKKFFNQIISEK